MPIPFKLIPLLLVLNSCAPDNGQVGEETVFCATLSMQSLQADEVSALGFNATDILSFSDGTHDGTLQWQGSGTTNLSIAVQHTGVTNHLTRGWIDDNGDLTEIHPELGCSDIVELELAITMRTNDGSLDETWMIPLQAESEFEASFSQSLASPNGSLDIRAFAPAGDFDSLQAYLNVSFSSTAGVSGTVTGQAESSSDSDIVSAESFDIASFAFQ